MSSEWKSPIENYVGLINGRKEPYLTIFSFLRGEILRYYNEGCPDGEWCGYNPKVMAAVIRSKIENGEIKINFPKDEKPEKIIKKINSYGVSRVIRATAMKTKLESEEEFRVTTTSSGGRVYHFRAPLAAPKLT
jgi:hypothetical protein